MDVLKSMKGIIAGVVVVIAIILMGAYLKGSSNSAPTACTTEAMQCPDGSYVGRSGPECAFAPCSSSTASSTSVDTSGWKTYSSATTTFKYPTSLGTTYISTVDWPPMVQALNQPYSCTEAGISTGRAGQTKSVTVNGHAYCVTTVSEGAAGSTYNQYAYAFAKDGKTVILTFTLREVQCANYNEPKASECTSERASFDVSDIIDGIAGTLVLK